MWQHIRGHEATPDEVAQIFANDAMDLRYEVVNGEERWTSIGHTDAARILVVEWTMRGEFRSNGNRFRSGETVGSGICPAGRLVKDMGATDRGINIPEFESEAQEARWWDEHKDLEEENLIAAMRDDSAQGGNAQTLVKEGRTSKNITIRMPFADLERARRLSARKGLAYHTFIKMLLHEALDREEKRPVG